MIEHHLAVTRTARYYTVGGTVGEGNGAGEDANELRELWIVCHGYGQLAARFLEAFEPLAAPWRRIVAPEGLSRFYLDRSRVGVNAEAEVGATWMTREDREHEIADQIVYLDALLDHLIPPESSSHVRLRVLGFSQGVATVSRWLVRGRRVRPDEVVLWAGSVPTDVDVADLAGRLAGAPVVFAVGTGDELASWAAADVEVGRFSAAGVDARLVTFNGGHRLDTATLSDIASR
jgi:predicted esterase